MGRADGPHSRRRFHGPGELIRWRALENRRRSDPQLASQPAAADAAEFQFERPDWTLFRSVDTLAQKAGVRKNLLRRLVLKELADNALDSRRAHRDGHRGQAGQLRRRRRRPGDRGTAPKTWPACSASTARSCPSKLWRMPSRGAMGNGLRVVVGAVAASDGTLRVTTRGQRYPRARKTDGSTAIERSEPAESFTGTTVEITFGPALPADRGALDWAEMAIDMALHGRSTPASRRPTGTTPTPFLSCCRVSATVPCASSSSSWMAAAVRRRARSRRR